MNDDTELLRRYVDNRSEPAFTALVQRHVGLVYSVALRRVGGDTHLAEDVAQQVFGALARKASSLTGRATISGWLYASAHLASAAVVRSEQRRKARETEAHQMQTILASSAPETDWSRLRPVIDDAIVGLHQEDREAIALRFFGQRSFAEVGAALRVTEEAARKRVDRALGKLRVLLERRGVTSAEAALGVALTAIGAESAPAGLGARVASQAYAHSGAAAGCSIANTVASAVLPVAAALILGGLAIFYQRQTNDHLRREFARLTALTHGLATLHTENRLLARTIAESQASRQAQAVRPARPPIVVEPPRGPRPVNARVSVSAQGTISWNREPVKLHDFIARLRTLQATADPESRLNIRGLGAEFPALAYVIDEVRKAGLRHVTVESNTTPDPKFGWSWFEPR